MVRFLTFSLVEIESTSDGKKTGFTLWR